MLKTTVPRKLACSTPYKWSNHHSEYPIDNLYKFDRELRKLISAELEKIEVAVRTKMARIFSLAHDAFWIEDASVFTNQTIYAATLEKISKTYGLPKALCRSTTGLPQTVNSSPTVSLST